MTRTSETRTVAADGGPLYSYAESGVSRREQRLFLAQWGREQFDAYMQQRCAYISTLEQWARKERA